MYDAPFTRPPDRESLGAALRELEAAKFRVERDARASAEAMKKQLVEQLLPVLDNLDRTITAADASGDAPAVVEGIALVRAQLEAVLRCYGVTRIAARGQRFDPALHEAIALAPAAPADAGLVVDELAAGYRYGAELLRAARVVVGRA